MPWLFSSEDGWGYLTTDFHTFSSKHTFPSQVANLYFTQTKEILNLKTLFFSVSAKSLQLLLSLHRCCVEFKDIYMIYLQALLRWPQCSKNFYCKLECLVSFCVVQKVQIYKKFLSNFESCHIRVCPPIKLYFVKMHLLVFLEFTCKRQTWNLCGRQWRITYSHFHLHRSVCVKSVTSFGCQLDINIPIKTDFGKVGRSRTGYQEQAHGDGAGTWIMCWIYRDYSNTRRTIPSFLVHKIGIHFGWKSFYWKRYPVQDAPHLLQSFFGQKRRVKYTGNYSASFSPWQHSRCPAQLIKSYWIFLVIMSVYFCPWSCLEISGRHHDSTKGNRLSPVGRNSASRVLLT